MLNYYNVFLFPPHTFHVLAFTINRTLFKNRMCLSALIHNPAFFVFKCFVVLGQILYVLSKNMAFMIRFFAIEGNYRIVLIAMKI